MDMKTFWAYVRKAPLGGKLMRGQMDGIKLIMDEWAQVGDRDDRKLAYILATAFHETGGTMQPVRETFAKTDKQAMARLEKAWAAGKLQWVKTPYWRDGWFGRGHVQLTHKDNYDKMGRVLGVPLVADPSLALDPKISVRILVEGMMKGLSGRGDFTGKSLEDYFTPVGADPVGARKIVNGTDKQKLIAGYYQNFLDAIQKARAVGFGSEPVPEAVVVQPDVALPDDKAPVESKSLWSVLISLVTGGTLLPALSGLDSWYAVAGLALVVAAVVAIVWMVGTGRLKLMRVEA